MKLGVLGSGSKGNAVIVSHAGVSLLLDAGFGPRVLASRATQIGLPLDTLVGIAVTHEHGDHAKGAVRVAKQANCSIFASAGTLAALKDGSKTSRGTPLTPHDTVQVGPFALTACPTNHDAAEPMAFVVEADGVRIGLAYDLGRATKALRFAFRDLHALIIEANHDEVLLRTGPYPASVKERIAGAGGHLSNRAAAQFASEVYHPGLSSIVLVHLSDKCNTQVLAKKTVAEHLRPKGFSGSVFVATQDEPLQPIVIGAEPNQFSLNVSA